MSNSATGVRCIRPYKFLIRLVRLVCDFSAYNKENVLLFLDTTPHVVSVEQLSCIGKKLGMFLKYGLSFVKLRVDGHKLAFLFITQDSRKLNINAHH